jgi:hypothetical protein
MKHPALESALAMMHPAELRNIVLQLPKTMEEIVGPVFHKLESISLGTFDVDWVRSQIQEQVSSGNLAVGLRISPDGTIQIEDLPIQSTPDQYANGVPVADDLSGVSKVEWRSWKDLKRSLHTSIADEEE